MSTHPLNPAEQIEAYLDGLLTPEQRRAFESRLREDAALRAEVELQGRVDASLKGLFAPPQTGALPIAGKAGAAPRWARWAGLAAAAAVLVAVGAWWANRAPSPAQGPQRPRMVAAAPALRVQYRREVANGFVPEAVCTTPEAFEGWVSKNYGEPLRPRETPEGVQFVGWSYARVISPYTGVLLARVDDQPVVVVMDKASEEKSPPAEGEGAEHIFRRQVGNLVLYEVSPLPEPRILPLLEQPQR